jgi:undecaprenyl-diphosphatase
VIQSGAVLAVLPLFRDRLHQFCFRWREQATQLYAAKILAAFVITGVPGFVLERKGLKLPEALGPVAWALLLGGIAFVVVEGWLRGRTPMTEVSWPIVIAVGIGQLIAAVFPGTSRSGATILLALVLGLNRTAAVEFTFLVGIPTMLAAGGWKILKALHHGTSGPREDWALVGLGFATASLVSFVAVKWLLRYIQSHTFTVFGCYRIALACFIAVLPGIGLPRGSIAAVFALALGAVGVCELQRRRARARPEAG